VEIGAANWYHARAEDRATRASVPRAGAGTRPAAWRALADIRAAPVSVSGSGLLGVHLMSLYVGEALVGDGAEVAHIDLLIGDKEGPVGVAFSNALANQSSGHSNLLAVLAPNLMVKPATVMITKVTIKGAKQAVQMFGPAQYGVAKAVADSVEEGIIPKDQADKLVIVCGVFIHWEAGDDKKIYQYNYEATKLSIARAMKGEPTASEMLSKKATAKHPFSGV
jgi:5,6,7,8-tetrahydromethanopterin hydro-lyase